MKEGNGEHSYDTNSHYQRSVFSEIEHVVIESFIEMLMNLDYLEYIKVAGCSSGRNTLFAMSEIVPDGLENNNTSIHINDTSPPDVYKSYLNQFKNDFSLFLRMRSEEIVPNGQMVLTFVGRKVSDPLSKDCFQVWSLLSDCILDLVSEVPNLTNLLSFFIFLTIDINGTAL
ncbi:hypothetical protein HID58_035134 [Brassica napus]|uniref:Uncharacterized protein n=1 Tax=Brassica napus TaxID=3708 RepID=A0ABQ8C5D7_BRANA|nr:hypothetical protein HID58_035134 [Brassica napus]